MSSPDARGLARARGAFTLIEVLAAVALLGILYAVLARVAIEGLRAEGDSQRRLEASLLADERVNDLIGAAAPAIGHTETAEGDFALAIDVTPFAIPTEWGVGSAETPAPLLLKSTRGGAQALRTVQITVAWLEGASERHVSRTLFLLDFQAVTQLAAATSGRAAAQAAEEEEPTPPAAEPSAPSPPDSP